MDKYNSQALVDQIFQYSFFSGLDLIEKLQTHENTEVYNRALAIIDRYFSEEQVCGQLLPFLTNCYKPQSLAVCHALQE